MFKQVTPQCMFVKCLLAIALVEFAWLSYPGKTLCPNMKFVGKDVA